MLSLSSAEFFFQNNPPGTLSECQTDWIRIRTYILLVLIWIQTVCKGYLQMTKFSAGMQELYCVVLNLDTLLFNYHIIIWPLDKKVQVT